MPKPRLPRRDCRHCGAKCRQPQSHFCSLQCIQDHAYAKRVRDVQRRNSLDGYSRNFRRRYMKDHMPHRCAICGRRTWMGQPIPLEMDHINGNSRDNRLVNLRWACGNCAMQLPTYKNRNKGNGRHYRRQRYANGQSY